MHEASIHRIWDPETGITDLETDPGELGVAEIPDIRIFWAGLCQELEGTTQLAGWYEELSREWAIETGLIENLYEIDRDAVQTLVAQGFRAELLSQDCVNKPRDHVVRLLCDQKDAFDGICASVKDERSLSTSYIKELHAVLLRSQETTEGADSLGHRVDAPLLRGDWKVRPNSPERDGVVYAYCPPVHVGNEMDRLVSMHADHVARKVPGEVQAAWLHHRFTQIHPFQDGNGRVARALATLVLVENGLFPLVVMQDDKSKYLDALEAADGGDLKPLVDLIARLQIARFRKAATILSAFRPGCDVVAAGKADH